MKYNELNSIWKTIFEAEWESVCHKSKAIAAVIVDEEDNIISVGRNKICETLIPNPKVLHAEVEAIRNLDINKYPNLESYTLYAALEPCPMCLGTIVIGGIRKLVIGAHDAYGGAVELLNKSNYISSKHIEVSWMPDFYSDMQRGIQAIREILYNDDKVKLENKLIDFSIYNSKGVNAAKDLVATGIFEKNPEEYSIEYIFNEMSSLIEKQ